MATIIYLDNYRATEPVYGPEPHYDTKIIELYPEVSA